MDAIRQMSKDLMSNSLREWKRLLEWIRGDMSKEKEAVILEQKDLKFDWRSIIHDNLFHGILIPLIVFFIGGPVLHFYMHIEIPLTLTIVSFLLLIVLYINYLKLGKKASNYHNKTNELYQKSFSIIRKGLITEMMQNAIWRFSQNHSSWKQQSTYDSYMVPPLCYCNRLVEGKGPPKFNPDAPYINNLFMSLPAIAITGVSTAMWLDPTLAFYLINTGLASFISNINDQLMEWWDGGGHNNSVCPSLTTTKTRQNNNKFDEYERQKKELLNYLATDLKTCLRNKFVARFFILNKDDLSEGHHLLPSLYALHELFGIRAYFIKKEGLDQELEKNKLKNEYDNRNEAIWGALLQNEKSPNNIKEDKKPEFLIFPCINQDTPNADVFTYWNGEVKTTSSTDSLELIKILAKICSQVGKDDINFWYRPTELNSEHSLVYLDTTKGTTSSSD